MSLFFSWWYGFKLWFGIVIWCSFFILRHSWMAVWMIAAVSFLVTRSFNRDEGAGVWGRIRATNKTSFLNQEE
jgi:hypothetical protein